jgi:hypothetical protein
MGTSGFIMTRTSTVLLHFLGILLISQGHFEVSKSERFLTLRHDSLTVMNDLNWLGRPFSTIEINKPSLTTSPHHRRLGTNQIVGIRQIMIPQNL